VHLVLPSLEEVERDRGGGDRRKVYRDGGPFAEADNPFQRIERLNQLSVQVRTRYGRIVSDVPSIR